MYIYKCREKLVIFWLIKMAFVENHFKRCEGREGEICVQEKHMLSRLDFASKESRRQSSKVHIK